MDFEVSIRKQFFRAYDFFKSFTKEVPLFDRLTMTEDRLENPAAFIDSMIRRIPTQSLYLDGSERQWFCIDGNKRLNAIKDFYNNVFPLEADIYNEKVKGLYHKDIKLYIVSCFDNYELNANIINPTDKISRLEIIKRIKQ
jgi:hypothetical protein